MPLDRKKVCYFDMKKLLWKHLIRDGTAYHAAYVSRSDGGGWATHTHDFYEVFWIDSGRGLHRLPNRIQPLAPGLLCFIRPSDVHGFQAVASSEPFALINVAFSAPAWKELRDRYSLGGPFFDETSAEAPFLRLEGESSRAAGRLFQEVVRAPRQALTRDAFLLALAVRFTPQPVEPGWLEAPAWLRRGLQDFIRETSSLEDGPARLAQRCGCSSAHLARTMTATLAVTPSAWIQQQRLGRAARLLESTGFSIAEVAQESGFGNLSHFHRRFREAFHETPLQYRRRRARPVL